MNERSQHNSKDNETRPATPVVPDSVRYVKNGQGGRWWKAARADNQIHVGWSNIPNEFLLNADLPNIRQVLNAGNASSGEFGALSQLLDKPSQHVWITFEAGFMWWCTVRDGANINPNGESAEQGNFWLACDFAWTNKSIGGRLLANADLPGVVTKTAGFMGTVCTPSAWNVVLRIIRDERDPDAFAAANARREYEAAVLKTVKRLSPKDFEQLIDLILARTGWARISTVGKSREGVDVEAENLAAQEIAFVQVKSTANQQVLDDYITRYKQRVEYYKRMIFAVHSPNGDLKLPSDLPGVQVWTGDRIAQLVVRLGLGEWVETRLA